MKVIITIEGLEAEKVANSFRVWGIAIAEDVPYGNGNLWVHIDETEIQIVEDK